MVPMGTNMPLCFFFWLQRDTGNRTVAVCGRTLLGFCMACQCVGMLHNALSRNVVLMVLFEICFLLSPGLF